MDRSDRTLIIATINSKFKIVIEIISMTTLKHEYFENCYDNLIDVKL
jgi:hypothetical protein